MGSARYRALPEAEKELVRERARERRAELAGDPAWVAAERARNKARYVPAAKGICAGCGGAIQLGNESGYCKKSECRKLAPKVPVKAARIRAEKAAGQGGLCALCGEWMEEGDRVLDHDHACCPSREKRCGECYRGVIHSRCNTLLGFAHDDADLLRKAAAFLRSGVRAPILKAPARKCSSCGADIMWFNGFGICGRAECAGAKMRLKRGGYVQRCIFCGRAPREGVVCDELKCQLYKRSGRREELARLREVLVMVQKGLCALCQLVLPEGDRIMDHDHACCFGGSSEACGTCYRGVIHHLCNAVLACALDDAVVLEKAILYLKLPF